MPRASGSFPYDAAESCLSFTHPIPDVPTTISGPRQLPLVPPLDEVPLRDLSNKSGSTGHGSLAHERSDVALPSTKAILTCGQPFLAS